MTTTIMTPGAYLRKRRLAAEFGLLQTARALTALASRRFERATLPLTPNERFARQTARLLAAEQNREPLTLTEAAELAKIIPLALEVYEQLVDLHFAGPDSGLPEPVVCRGCGCSFLDPCISEFGTCGWSSSMAALCTHCAASVFAPAIVEQELAA